MAIVDYFVSSAKFNKEKPIWVYESIVVCFQKLSDERRKISAATELGVNTGMSNSVSSRQANKLLRMYPQPDYEVKITHGKSY